VAKLTAKGRKSIKPSNFAVPKGKGSDPSKNQYPIHDKSHAANALARVQQNGTPTEKAMVRRAVTKKYPSLAGAKKKGKK